MNRFTTLIFAAVVLFATPHRMLAPVIEEETPTPLVPAKPKRQPANDTNPTRGFEGEWHRKDSQQMQTGMQSWVSILKIRKGSADTNRTTTFILNPETTWPNWPAPHNSASPVSITTKSHSTEMKAEGSNLQIIWSGSTLIDWSPKTIPANLFDMAEALKVTKVLYVLRGSELLSIWEGKTYTWTRVK
jgi:hypothetical protein